MSPVFERVSSGQLDAITSAVALAGLEHRLVVRHTQAQTIVTDEADHLSQPT